MNWRIGQLYVRRFQEIQYDVFGQHISVDTERSCNNKNTSCGMVGLIRMQKGRLYNGGGYARGKMIYTREFVSEKADT